MSRRKSNNTRHPKDQYLTKSESSRRERSRALGQNFLRHRRDAERIVEMSGVGSGDLVVEFGPGSGMLTEPLSRRVAKVIAVEKDPHLFRVLRDRFDESTVKVINGDALEFRLPKSDFKVVSNVPFGATTGILDHLLYNPMSGPISGALLVQEEVAVKHTRRGSTSLKTLSWSPWYELRPGPRFPATSFRPQPRVDARVLHLRRRRDYLLDPARKRDFERFVREAFRYGTPHGVGAPLGRYFSKKRLRRLAKRVGFEPGFPPSRLDVHQWVEVFLDLG